MVVVVTPEGMVRTLYHEAWSLAALGSLHIQRASHVEPTADGQWFARIIQGPTLGPFSFRSEALAAEIDWLTRERLSSSTQEQSTHGNREECRSGVVGDLSGGADRAADQ
jgi:hypothetical protein